MNQRIVKIYTAAYLFSIQPKISVADLAAQMNVPEGSVYRMARSVEWDEALDALGYTGDRTFRREPRRSLQREQGDTVKRTYTVIDELMAEGLTEKQAVTRTAQMLDLPRRRIYEWNRKRK